MQRTQLPVAAVVALLVGLPASGRTSFAQPLPPRIDLGELAVGDGIELVGVEIGDRAEPTVVGVGDFNHADRL